MDTQMSPTPTPGTDLRPTPCAEAGEEGKARWGEGREGLGTGVGRQASKAIQNVCGRRQSFLLCYDRTERATGLSKASLHLPL